MTSGSRIWTRVSISALAVAAVGLTAGQAQARSLDQSFEPAGLARIVVDLALVDELTLERSTGAARVTLTGKDAPECEATLVRSGDTLRLTAVRHHLFHHDHDCDLVVHVAAPSSAALAVDVGAGTVQLVALASSVELTLGAGDVEGSVSAHASVRTGAGRVRLHDLTSPVEVKTGLGDVDLTFAAAPAGNVRASSGLGTIELEFPAGTAVDASLGSGLGSVTNSLRQRDDAPTHVHASTGLGTIVLGSR